MDGVCFGVIDFINFVIVIKPLIVEGGYLLSQRSSKSSSDALMCIFAKDECPPKFLVRLSSVFEIVFNLLFMTRFLLRYLI